MNQDTVPVVSLVLTTSARARLYRICLSKTHYIPMSEPLSHEQYGPLLKSIINYDWSACDQLLKAGKGLDERDRLGRTPLHWAAQRGNLELSMRLIDMGLPVNIEDCWGETPLHVAIYDHYHDNSELCRALIARGASVHQMDCRGDSAIHYAVFNENPVFCKIIAEAGADMNAVGRFNVCPLHIAVGNRNTENVKILLAHGAHPDTLDENHNTALHRAAREGNLAICEALLRSGASPNSRIPKDADINIFKTPLHIAVEKGHLAVCKLLLDRGAETESKCADGRTPLFYTVMNKNRQRILLQLLKAGADINVEDSHGFRPIHWACLTGLESVAQVLIDQGADLNVQVKGNATPLHIAAESKVFGICRRLLAAGADPSIPDKEGRFPEEFISKREHGLRSEFERHRLMLTIHITKNPQEEDDEKSPDMGF